MKQGILLGFRLGELTKMGDATLSFVDKDTFPARQFAVADKVRVVPGGSSVREGAYVAPSVICMPPMFINVGAYVDEGTMVDSHALVGSCAQVGKRVHLSAAAQIGGVLEPVNAAPVIIEDDVLVGGNCGVYEGTLVRARAVLGAGTILTRSTPLYDIVRGQVYKATDEKPLEVPENAVVVPGSRAVKKGQAADVESFALHAGHREVSRREERTRGLSWKSGCARFATAVSFAPFGGSDISRFLHPGLRPGCILRRLRGCPIRRLTVSASGPPDHSLTLICANF